MRDRARGARRRARGRRSAPCRPGARPRPRGRSRRTPRGRGCAGTSVAGDDHLRRRRARSTRVHVEHAGRSRRRIRLEVIDLAAEAAPGAVAEVAALVERHAEHLVTGAEDARVDGHVRLGTGVGWTLACSAPKSALARSRRRSRPCRRPRSRRSTACRALPRRTCCSSHEPSASSTATDAVLRRDELEGASWRSSSS